MSTGTYYAILLAAGTGSRFGGSKLTAPWNGSVLLHTALQSASSAPVAGVIVVTGADSKAVGAAVEAFAEGGPPIRSVHCADYALGMSASLRCGLAALPDDATGAMIFLADMPRIPAAIAQQLVDAVDAGAAAAVPAFAERLGHPVLITRSLFARFSNSGGDGEGRSILRGLDAAVAIVRSDDDGVLFDVDTPADLLPSPGISTPS